MSWIYWLIFSGIMVVGEIISVSFFLIWFAIGGICGMIVSIFSDNLIMQFSVFLVVSISLLLATKPLTKKFFASKSKVESNIDSLIGKKARVIEDIVFIEGSGKVKVQGELWKAISENSGETIPKDTEVTVVAVDGVKLIVKI